MIRAFFAALLCLAALAISQTSARAMACSVGWTAGPSGLTVDVLPGTAVDTTATFAVTCSGGSASQAIRFCLNVGPGTTATGPSGERVLRSSSDYLDWEFYSDSGRTQVWGSWGIGSSSAYPSGAGVGVQQDVTLNGSGGGTFNYTIYARILANQSDTLPGSFTWSGSEPTVQYIAKSGASACPTSGGSAGGSAGSFTATVPTNCTVTTGTLDFGSNGITIASNIDQSTTVSAKCTNGTPYSVGLNNGANASGAQNRMRLGATANYLNYELYTNVGRTTAWSTTTAAGSCTGGAGTCSLGTGTGATQSVTVYGRVPTQTASAAGAYTDTVVVTVTF